MFVNQILFRSLMMNRFFRINISHKIDLNYQPVTIVDETKLFSYVEWRRIIGKFRKFLQTETDTPFHSWKVPNTKFSLPSYFSRYDRGKPLRPCHPYVAILSRKRISPRRAVHVACIRSGTNGASSTIERDGNPRLFDREFSKYLSYLRIQSGLKTWSEKLTASPLIRAVHTFAITRD